MSDAPTCRKCKTRPCNWYGVIGGYSVQCIECNIEQCQKRRAAAAKKSGPVKRYSLRLGACDGLVETPDGEYIRYEDAAKAAGHVAGKLGGAVSSWRKQQAARRNGKKGGRPPKVLAKAPKKRA